MFQLIHLPAGQSREVGGVEGPGPAKNHSRLRRFGNLLGPGAMKYPRACAGSQQPWL